LTYYHPHLVVAIVLYLNFAKARLSLCCGRRWHRGRGRRPAAQNQRARGSRHRWRQGAADKDNDDDDGARSSDRPRSSPTGGGGSPLPPVDGGLSTAISSGQWPLSHGDRRPEHQSAKTIAETGGEDRTPMPKCHYDRRGSRSRVDR
jgi:hypothetical protein